MQTLPELCWVSIDELQVDERYQRDATGRHAMRHIQNIAAHFDWCKMKPLSVSRRACGGLFVMDGQHELEALKIRQETHGDVGDLAPCFVHAGSNLADEADSFVAINRDRVKVHVLQLHHAALMAGDGEALEIDEVCRVAGIKILRYPAANGKTPPGTTAAVGAIRQAIKRYGRKTVIKGLSALAKAYAGQEGQLRASLVRGVIAFCKTDPVVDPARLVAALAIRSAVEWELRSREWGAQSGKALSLAMSDLLAENVAVAVVVPRPSEAVDVLYQGKRYEDDPRLVADGRR